MGIFGHHQELYICTNCETIDDFRTNTKGSFFAEIFIWIFSFYFSIMTHWSIMLIAIGYSVWRLSSRSVVCSACGSVNKVPLSSPVGQKLTSQDGTHE
jgi:hypothetical protein